MRLKLLFTFVLGVAISGPSAAQQAAAPALQGTILDGTALPGQAWITLGNLSPIEHNDVYSQSYMEQGAAVFATNSGSITLTPYVSLALTLDTKGYAWNNKVEPRFGIKLNKLFRSGVVSFGSAYAYESRFDRLAGSAPVLYAQDWFGWQPLTNPGNRFPGSSWAAIGNISPVEHGNIIAQGNLSQGVVAKRIGGVSLVPYGEMTFSRDRRHFDWNNKAVWGAGVKAAFPYGHSYAEMGAAYFDETRLESGRAAGGLAVFMNAWWGWNLLSKSRGR